MSFSSSMPSKARDNHPKHRCTCYNAHIRLQKAISSETKTPVSIHVKEDGFMNTILEQFQEKIKGTFSFFDRIIIKGHIRQLFSPSGKRHFLSHNNVLLKDFSAYAQTVTKNLCEHIEKLATDSNRPVAYLTSAKTSKEQTALQILLENPVEEGLICALSVVEYCQTLQPKKQEDGKLSLCGVNRKCKYYYLYFLDKEFGFMHVKIQTWFPFLIQVYINGREMMKHIFDQNDITYKMYDNSFIDISDVQKAQELADKFDSKKLCRRLDCFAKKVNPYLDTIYDSFHQGYFWCVDQCEYATDVMFTSREALEDIYPSLVGHAFYSFKCEDVFSFMGRKLDAKFLGEIVSDYRKRPEGFRIKHKMKSNSIKMYDKFSVLRIEMTINDSKEFKIRKEVRHKDGITSMQWRPMGKSIANLYRYAEVSKSSTFRYLGALKGIVPVKAIEREINGICRNRIFDGKRFGGFNVWEEKTFHLFSELSNASFLIRGFTNQDIRRVLFTGQESELKTNRNRVSRLFAKLRAHGLIKKVPRSLRYHLTEKGRRIFSALIETKRKTFPELVAS